MRHSLTQHQKHSSNLTFYIWEGLLVGLLAGNPFEMSALSGGGGGSTKSAPADTVNNPYNTGLETRGRPGDPNHVHGGPIPPGRYKIRTPAVDKHVGLSARLDPENKPKKHARGGFLIHNRGPHGSDGCIVPAERNDSVRKSQFNKLITGLSVSRGGSLIVAESMSGDRFA
jgi:hypothetical protein